jgi:amino acid transporter
MRVHAGNQQQPRTLGVASATTLLVLACFVTPLFTGVRTTATLGSGASAVPWLLSAMALGLVVRL